MPITTPLDGIVRQQEWLRRNVERLLRVQQPNAVYGQTVLVKNLISAQAGTLLIAKSAATMVGVMQVPTADTWYMQCKDPPDGGFLFANGDICYIKANQPDLTTAETWFTVANRTDNGNGTQNYVCTYQSGDRPILYPDGSVIIDYGVSGQGWLMLTADGANSPRYSIYTHAGAPWTTQAERGRFGLMNGAFGVVTDVMGFGVGDYAAGNYLKYDTAGGFAIKAGGGLTQVGSDGLSFLVGSSYDANASLKFKRASDGALIATMAAYDTGPYIFGSVGANSVTGIGSRWSVYASAPAGQESRLLLYAGSSTSDRARIELVRTAAGANQIEIDANGGTVAISGDITVDDDLAFSGTAKRITGDLTNATLASRVLFQSSTTNGTTSVGAIPNGTGTAASFTAVAGSDPDNAARVSLVGSQTGAVINSTKAGTGTTQAILLQIDGTTVVTIPTTGQITSTVDITAGKAKGLQAQLDSETIYNCSTALDLSTTLTDVAGMTTGSFTPTVNEYALVDIGVVFNDSTGTAACNAADILVCYLNVTTAGVPADQADRAVHIAPGNAGAFQGVRVYKISLTAGTAYTINARARNVTGNRGRVTTDSWMRVRRIAR